MLRSRSTRTSAPAPPRSTRARSLSTSASFHDGAAPGAAPRALRRQRQSERSPGTEPAESREGWDVGADRTWGLETPPPPLCSPQGLRADHRPAESPPLPGPRSLDVGAPDRQRVGRRQTRATSNCENELSPGFVLRGSRIDPKIIRRNQMVRFIFANRSFNPLDSRECARHEAERGPPNTSGLVVASPGALTGIFSTQDPAPGSGSGDPGLGGVGGHGVWPPHQQHTPSSSA